MTLSFCPECRSELIDGKCNNPKCPLKNQTVKPNILTNDNISKQQEKIAITLKDIFQFAETRNVAFGFALGFGAYVFHTNMLVEIGIIGLTLAVVYLSWRNKIKEKKEVRKW